jgi:hypothetical protein
MKSVMIGARGCLPALRNRGVDRRLTRPASGSGGGQAIGGQVRPAEPHVAQLAVIELRELPEGLRDPPILAAGRRRPWAPPPEIEQQRPSPPESSWMLEPARPSRPKNRSRVSDSAAASSAGRSK